MAATRTRIGVDEPDPGDINKFVSGVQLNDGTEDVVLQTVVLADPETLAQLGRINASGELTVVEASAADIKTAAEAILAAQLADGHSVILAANSGVDIGDVDVTSVVPGVAATSLGKAEDAVFTTGDVGVMALAVRKDAAATVVSAETDYHPLLVDDNGRLYTAAKLAANSGVDIGDVDVTSVVPGTAATNLGKAVGSAKGATDTGVAPLAVRDDALSALGDAESDYVPLRVDANGALWVHDNVVNTLLGTIDADTGNIATSIQAIDGAIIGPGEPTIDSCEHIAINLGAGADNVLKASAANKQIWVLGFGFSCSAEGTTVSFQDEADAALSGIMEFAEHGGMLAPLSGNFAMPYWKLATDKDLEVDITGGDVDGWVTIAVVSV